MRILAVSHPCVTDVNQQFYAELEARGAQVHLIVPSNFRTEYAIEPVKVNRWPSFSGQLEQRKVALGGSIPLHFYRSDLRSSLLRFAPDVLFVEEEPYSASAWQAFYASRGMKLKRVVYSAQNIVKQYPQPFRTMEQYVLARTDLAAVVSREVGNALAAKGYGGKLMPFPLGADTVQFKPDPVTGSRLRREQGIGSHEFVIGYVGRFVIEKGIMMLIDALPALEANGFKLVMVGGGPLLEQLCKAQAQFPETLRVVSGVLHNEVQHWMNAFDLLALPSLTMPNWKEQFGRVLIESMACGIPVLGSDSGEIPVLIGQTGGGWIFPEGDVREFTAAVSRIHAEAEERRARAENGYAYVQENFSKGALADSFLRHLHWIDEPGRAAR